MNVTPKNPYEKISPDVSLELLEQQLNERLQDCEIWGDLKLSKDEYEELKRSIAREFSNSSSANTLKRILHNYPVIITTDIIFFVLNEYDNNDLKQKK